MITSKFLFLFFSCCYFIFAHPIQHERISIRKCKEYANATISYNYVMGVLRQQNKVMTVSKCKHSSTPLVVGGNNAQMSEFPHQALLGYGSVNNLQWACGGSLVSENYILTAAHCMYASSRQVSHAKLGMNSREQKNDKVFIYKVEEMISHPSYKRGQLNHDIALLKLDDNVVFTEFLYPICLPTTQPANSKAVLTGFGQTGRHESATQKLMKVKLDKFSNKECQNIFRAVRIDDKTMLCFGDHNAKADACRGDSGGPIQVANDEMANCTYKILGVVSFGAQDCGTPGVPGVYMNVYHYLDWIEENVWRGET